MAENNETLLKEIRERWDYHQTMWRDIRDEARIDMRYRSGDPWDQDERKARKDANRLCLSLDELGQYVNQLINDVRQNPISAKVDPQHVGVSEEDAEITENRLRDMESRSRAQQAYITAFECAAERSYGYFGYNTRYVTERPGSDPARMWEQEVIARTFLNPDTVSIDPDCKEADCSDMGDAFVIDSIPKAKFARDWPNAKIKDFTSEVQALAPTWITDQNVQVAEYWKVVKNGRRLLLLAFPDGLVPFYASGEDDPNGIVKVLPKSAKVSKEFVEFTDIGEVRIENERQLEERKVVQYITNGVEILEKKDWAGKYIPIVPVFGKQMYVDTGSGSKRVLMSLIRLARDPQMLYCYLRTQEAEEAQMAPRAPFVGYEGQFEGHEDEWSNCNRVPYGYLQVKAVLDSTGAPVPLPSRPQFTPNFQAYEIAAEAARRAIQSAMGISPLPTSAQRQNEKSGIALERIQGQQQHGSSHFIDNYKRALEHGARVAIDLMQAITDTPRHVSTRKADGKHELVRIDDPARLAEAELDVSIATGPSRESQREEAAEFVDLMVSNLATLPVDPAVKGKILAMSIKLKQLGPIGDAMTELLDPQKDGEQPIPPQAQAQMQQMAEQLQTMNSYVQQLEQQAGEIRQQLDSKVLDLQSKERIEQMRMELEKTIKLSELEFKKWDREHTSAHDIAKQNDQQAFDAEMADKARIAAEQQAERDRQVAAEGADDHVPAV